MSAAPASERAARRLHVAAFGCQMSVADSGELAAPLLARGFSPAASPEGADAVVVSTCTVRQHAEDRAVSFIGRLRAWKEEDPSRVLIVAGCAAERLGESLRARFPHIDLVAGAKSAEDYPRLVEEALAGRFDGEGEARLAAPPREAAPAAAPGWSSTVSAYVTVMRGCGFACSYCVVPAVRGPERLRSAEAVLREAAEKASRGAREIVLLGQTVNAWRGLSPGGERWRFPDLLRAAAALEGVRRVRFESPHPSLCDASLAEALGSVPGLAGPLHMPAQSGSDRVLAAMRRGYSARELLDRAEALRRAARVELSTDIIVGFPSESDEDFARTLAFVEELRPAWTYAFKYSPREGTESAALPDDVPRPVKEERLARLNALCDGLTAEALRSWVGREVSVLDEGGGGRSREGLRVRLPPGGEPGRLVRARVTEAGKRTLRGEVLA